jgi:hypothetical protein
VDNGSFTSHGSIEVTCDNNLVTLDIAGPWNIEFFQEMSEKLNELRPELNLQNHTGLVVLHGEALPTPEAMSYFTTYLTGLKTRAVAINLQYTNTPSITQNVCHKAYTQANIKHDFFLDNDSAIKWLRSCMAS